MINEERNIESFIQDGMMEYSGYVLLNRCIPDLRDSCKPVIRRILFTMLREKAFKFIKSATITGKTMAVHPHSDCYPTIVGMVQTDKQLTPWLIGKGNFAQHTSRDLQASASRYSEVKLGEYATEVLKDLNSKTVKWIPNYDGTIMMPEVLPVKFPMILNYCQSGIGVGMASNIPSFNMIEIADVIEKYNETGEQSILIPDFSTKGLIINNYNNLNKINNTGLGTITLRGSFSVEGNSILIDSIPYSTTREAIIDKVIELIKKGDLKEVINIKDLTGLNGMCIEIECKKNANIDRVVGLLYENTPFQSTFSSNMNVLCDGLPKVMGAWEIIDKWMEWRIECVKNTYTQEILEINDKLHIYQALVKIIDYIDDVIDIIKNSTDENMIENLMKKFNMDKVQAEHISELKLKNINKSYIQKTIKDEKSLKTKIETLKEIISDESKIKDVIVKEIKIVAQKYGKPRQTKIISEEEIKQTPQEVLIEDFTTTLILSEQGYFKKTLRYSETQKLKDGDEVKTITQCSNKDKAIFISNQGNAYFLNLWEVNEKTPSTMGDYLQNLLPLEKDEIIIGMLTTNQYKGEAIYVFENSKIAKIPLSSFETKTNRTKLSNSIAQDNGQVLLITQITDDVDIELTDCFDKNKVINTKDINSKASKNTVGVTSWNCKKSGFSVISAKVLANKQ